MSYRNKSIRTLLSHHSWSEDVLEWHGIHLDQVDPSWSLVTACHLFQVDVAKVEAGLASADIDCSSTSDWTSLGWIAPEALDRAS